MIKTKARVFADTRDMSRDEWLGMRRKGIGGSDASAIMGVNPYSSPLSVYLDKIGKGKGEEENEAMREGRDLEDYVAKRFTEETGLKVKRLNKMLQHPEYPWMLANIDRDIGGVDAGLECKTTSPYSKFKFDEGEINPHYYWQCMHYMAVTGAAKWYVAVLVLGKAFWVFEVNRDEAVIQSLIEAESEFWNNNVVPKNPPLPTGSEADDEALSVMYPQGEDDEEIVDLSDDLMDVRMFKAKQRDDLDKEIEQIDQQLKQTLGKHQHGQSARWKVSWSNVSSNRIDTKLLKERYPKIAAEVTNAKPSRRFSVSGRKDDE